jgi:hypothetical protein
VKITKRSPERRFQPSKMLNRDCVICLDSLMDDANEKIASLVKGTVVCCRVDKSEPGGYGVEFDDYPLKGYLPTVKELQCNEKLEVSFVCLFNGRMLVTL